jgi:hypothetical protein
MANMLKRRKERDKNIQNPIGKEVTEHMGRNAWISMGHDVVSVKIGKLVAGSWR